MSVFFKRKSDNVKKSMLDSTGLFQQQNVAAGEASYVVALIIAKSKKPQKIEGLSVAMYKGHC